MVVTDDERGLRLLAHVFDASNPAPEFIRGIQIVIAIMRTVVREPLLIIAPVQANVAHTSESDLRRRKRLAEKWLIDIAEADAHLREGAQDRGIVPGGMSHFDHQRILTETAGKLRQVVTILIGVLE